MSEIFECPLCPDFQAPDFKLLLPHIRLVHSTRPGFSLQCNIENCTRIFKNMKTYTNHIYGDHISLPRTASAYHCASNHVDEDEQMEGVEYEQENTYDPTFAQSFDFKKIVANWILRIKECLKLTQAAMEEIMQRITDLNQFILSKVHSAVITALAESEIDARSRTQLQEIFDPNGEYGRPFKDLETSHLQLEYFKKNLGFVVKHNCYKITFLATYIHIRT